MLALWNGEASQGLGGTEDIVSFARGLGSQVVWIHSTTGATRVFNERLKMYSSTIRSSNS